MSNLHPYKTHFVLFLEMGFIAVNQADEDSALKLFRAAQVLNPESLLPKIGTGYLYLHKLELKQACKMFEEVLHQEPHNEMALALMGIALSFSPNQATKGEAILEKTAHSSHDSAVKNVCDSAIKFINKFVKKAPSPMEKPLTNKKPPHG